ncbi:hypothetical protein [Lentzea sp. NPDC051838]|uniref:hypothetical protein n=1 Tax=Lentzea sp. NPDC051838 TaxID=3154849 RepID=UPI0034160966
MIKVAAVAAVSALAFTGLTGTASAQSTDGCMGMLSYVQLNGGLVGGNLGIECFAGEGVVSKGFGWIETKTGDGDWTRVEASEQREEREGRWSVSLALSTPCLTGTHSYRMHGGSSTVGGSDGEASGPASTFTC